MKRNKLKKLPSRPGTHVSLSKKSCLRQKSRVISQAASNKDFDALLRLGQSPGGFVSDRLRRIIWPLLLGLEDQQLPWSVEVSDPPDGIQHQVKVDVDRTQFFTQFPKEVAKGHRRNLEKLIHYVLSRQPRLHYYQGFHEVCAVFLIVLGDRLGAVAAERLAIKWLKDAMQPTLDPTLNMLSLLYPLLWLEDHRLYNFICSVDGLQPHFCISWILTWCAHDVPDYAIATRLFDLFLTSNPLMPLYVVAARMLIEQERIMAEDPDDFPILHSMLGAFPKALDLEELLATAQRLYLCHPPKKLQKRAKKYLGQSSCVNQCKDAHPVVKTASSRRALLTSWPSLGLLAAGFLVLLLSFWWPSIDLQRWM